MNDVDRIQAGGFSSFNGIITGVLEGEIVSDRKPSLRTVFKNNATEICALRKLGWTASDFVDLIRRAGYETSVLTVQKYFVVAFEFADREKADQLARTALTSKRPKAARLHSPHGLNQETTSASPSPLGKSAETPIRDRRLGHDASKTQAPGAAPANDGGSGKRPSPPLPSTPAVAGPHDGEQNNSQSEAAPLRDDEQARQRADVVVVQGVSRTFSEFREAVKQGIKNRTAMVTFNDGGKLFVQTRLHQKIVAGVIGSWEQFYKNN